MNKVSEMLRDYVPQSKTAQPYTLKISSDLPRRHLLSVTLFFPTETAAQLSSAMLSPGPIPRSSRKKYNRLSRSSSRTGFVGKVLECDQNRAIICILVFWLLLTMVTYQQIYGSDHKRAQRSKGAIPLDEGGALDVFGHLENKINEHERFLAQMGVETKGDGGSNGKQSNSVPDESVIHPLPDKAVKSEETPRPTPSPTDKPSAKPTEKKKEGKAVDRFGVTLTLRL